MADQKTIEFLSAVASYYSAKLAEHGRTARGADWNSEKSQILRFQQLSQLIVPGAHFSLNDLGCGYGALYDYLKEHYGAFAYTGCDISEAMIVAARDRQDRCANARFFLVAKPPDVADYGVASGIFNVRLDRSDCQWREYIETALDDLDRTSLRGFAFNCLSLYSDPEKRREYLYYADPRSLFDLCKRRYSHNVALLHDYGLYEFTIIVRKTI